VQSPNPWGVFLFRGKIIEEKYLIKKGNYIVDLQKVDFITWRNNEKSIGKYLLRLHIGSKEVGYMCQTIDEVKKVINSWGMTNGKEIEIEDEEIIWD
jgi:hypothetical protein